MKLSKPSTRKTVVFVAVLLIIILVLLAATCQAERDAALRSVADHLGTQANYRDVVAKMTAELNNRKGASRAEVHAFLETFGRVSYLGPFTSQSGTDENATWVPVDVPFGLGTATVWDLSYDGRGRLIKVELIDAP
jgi:hypothetical protein